METRMKLRMAAIIALLGGALAVPALAQGGGGQGMQNGPGMGKGCYAQTCGGGGGRGPGAKAGRGMRFNQNNTPGWSLMTPEERSAQQAKMRSVKTFDECKVVQNEHRALMEGRAKEKGETLNVPRRDGCEVMRSRGLIG